MSGDPPAERNWASGPWPHLLWVTAAAIVLDLGALHARHDADSLVPALVSLDAWTFYYWEQNRYGMLVALLAAPFRHPFTNLLIQNGVTIWAGLACFPLAARYVGGPGGWRPVAGPLAAAAFLLLAPGDIPWMFLSTFNVFSVSLALGLAGLLAAERRSPAGWAVAIGCFALAAWVNSAVGVLLLPVVLAVGAARWLLEGGREPIRAAAAGAALGVFAALFAKVLERTPPPAYRTTWLVVPPATDWPGLLGATAVDFWGGGEPAAWAAFAGACALAAAARGWRGAVLLAAVLLAAAAYSGAMGILFKGRWRYAVPALVLAHAAAVQAAALWLPVGRRAVAAAGLAAVAAALLRFGPPSVERVAADLRAKYGSGAAQLEATGCTHVAGDYWAVWPAVFVSAWDAADRGDGRRVWGLSHRSGPTTPQWKAVPRQRVRVGAFRGDAKAADYLPLRAPLQVVEERGDLVIYAPK